MSFLSQFIFNSSIVRKKRAMRTYVHKAWKKRGYLRKRGFDVSDYQFSKPWHKGYR